MDDTPEQKPVQRHKGLKRLGLAVFAVFLLYQWYYVSPTCSANSKHVWMWITPSGLAEKNPDKPHVVLFRVPSAYIEKNTTPGQRTGGHVEFLSLNVSLEDGLPPDCIREMEITRKEGRHYIRRAPKDNPEYIDGHDTKKVHLTVGSFGGWESPNEYMRRIPSNFEGFDAYIDEYGQRGESNEYLFATKDRGDEKRSMYCARSALHNNQYSLCEGSVLHKGIWIRYLFHYSQLQKWKELEKQAKDFVDSITIIGI